MITGDKSLGYSLVCDSCENMADDLFDEFMDAVNFKKDKSNGWASSKNKSGNWDDCCPDCKSANLSAGLFGGIA
jgi:hypothetical protein